ncbi:hypothetical protein HF313_25185 [Massilia atriviolacea]|uniref:WD40 repeat domain-containing protein n=1 Tax=Massilia atriviolacea TaxID=2495579 RepID=A0A430HNG3_9BURK|nr:hypothetical protein [Massilia atriviolacea]RSZ59024.1 hypothetical protein EJB06_11895 [Massilia atriviolacea]
MNRNYPNSVTFVAGCAVEADYIYVASYGDKFDPQEYAFSRMFAYVGRLDGNKWYHHDIESNIVSVCVKKPAGTVGRRLCALSKEGEFEIFSNGDGSIISEKIPEAGLRLGSRGYLCAIREIGNAIFACGANDQVYRRDDGVWTLLTSSPLQIRTTFGLDFGILSSIDGSSETDVYTCGLSGKLYHFDGHAWKQLPLPTDEHLNCVRVISKDEVWICGNNGTLLKGSARTGFQNMSSIDDNFIFWSLAKFGDSVYLATSNQGLFYFDGARIQRVVTGFKSELWTYQVDAVHNMLWSFGPKEIACFDGITWKLIDHPDNPPT